MLTIEKFDHVGIRISEKAASVAFYQTLGFSLIADAGFEQGHPIIMRNKASGVTINLLGPSTSSTSSTSSSGTNVLMDLDEKHPGYTHMALRVASMEETKAFLQEEGIPTTGSFSFGGLTAVFIRDPDRNVIELDEFRGDESEKGRDGDTDFEGYENHP
jgi:catechol 2,3-dioxygenase-like lactoylglutathione lyase family enzyme